MLWMRTGGLWEELTGGIEQALEKAREAAGDKDVRIGGGVATIRQYLQAGRIDEMHLAYSPVVLGAGESLFNGIDLKALGYQVQRYTASKSCMHVEIGRE